MALPDAQPWAPQRRHCPKDGLAHREGDAPTRGERVASAAMYRENELAVPPVLHSPASVGVATSAARRGDNTWRTHHGLRAP